MSTPKSSTGIDADQARSQRGTDLREPVNCFIFSNFASVIGG